MSNTNAVILVEKYRDLNILLKHWLSEKQLVYLPMSILQIEQWRVEGKNGKIMNVLHSV